MNVNDREQPSSPVGAEDHGAPGPARSEMIARPADEATEESKQDSGYDEGGES